MVSPVSGLNAVPVQFLMGRNRSMKQAAITEEVKPQKTIKAFNKMLKAFIYLAGVTRLELATSCVTGKRSNQTELHPRNS